MKIFELNWKYFEYVFDAKVAKYFCSDIYENFGFVINIFNVNH